MKNWLRIAGAETRAELLKTMRMPAFAIPTLAFPMLFYIIFGTVLQFAPGIERFALAGYGAFGVIGPALFGFGVGVAGERSAGWLLLKHASPMPPSAYLLAKMLMAASFAAAIVASLYALAYLGADVRMTASAWMSLAAVLILGVIPFCAMGLAIGFRVPGSAAAAVVNLVYLPMSALSGLWFPLRLFPDSLQALAWMLPPFHLGQLALKTVGMDAGHPWWWHGLALLVVTLLFAWMALRAYRSDSAVLAVTAA